jgi:putative DNA primase/helicase
MSTKPPFDYEAAIAQIRARRNARMKPPGEETKKPVPKPASAGNGPDRVEWEEPKPLPSGLAPVEAFNSDFMPGALAPWIDDVATRLQCPPDYVAVAAITALGAVIGRRIGIKPQRKTDWVEVPNLWGAFIGRPGMLKSPAMREALKPIHRLEAEAAKDNEVAMQAYAAAMDIYKVRKQVADQLAKRKLKKDTDAAVDFALGSQPEEPRAVRYRTSDATYEGLGEVLIANPSGVLIERDELISLLKHLDRDDQAVARGFYLTGWSGLDPYTFDRIGRGQRHIEAVCVSVLGNTQPVRIAEYVRRANYGGAGGDGLMQRFGLLVWPNTSPDWKDVDQFPHGIARERAWQAFDRASKLDIAAALALGASKGEFDKVPALRFADDAHAEFLDWREDLERRLRSDELSPALEGHLAKYRKLVPALALINHLCDNQAGGPVPREAVVRALAFAGYLEGHARRVYRSSSEGELAAAKAILLHIKAGDLKDGFTARDVHQRDWAHLTERDQVGAGLNLLVELGHLADVAAPPGPQGGRPTVTYRINPRGIR